MTPRSDSPSESSAYPDDSRPDENLPGEMLAEELADPQPWAVAPDETEAEELEGDAARAADVPGDTGDTVADAEQLAVAETAAARARSSRPRRRVAEVEKAPAPAAKGRAASRSTAVAPRRTTPARFAQESAEELRKVVWPSGPQVRQLFAAVLVLVVFVIAFVGLLDLFFGWALLRLFGMSE